MKKLPATLALLASLLLLFYALIWLIGRLQLWRCPPQTFLAGGEHLVLQNFPLLFCAIALALLVLWAAVTRSPTLFRLLGGEDSFGDANERREGIRAATLVFLVTAAIGLAMSSANFCLAPSHILVRPWPWQAMREFGWRDVDLVETKCWHSRGWNTTFSLYLRSGEEIEVSHNDLAGAYPHIKRSLVGLPFAFDPRGVDPNCDVDEKDLLLHRP